MIRSKRFGVSVIFSMFILATSFVASTVYAAGVVPCGGPTEKPCTLCHLFVGIKNITDYFMGVMVFLALAIVLAMGVLYIVSAGNQGLIGTAKKGLWAALSGIAIVLFAWLVVNLIIFWLLPTKSDLGVNASFSIQHGFQMTCDTTSSAGTAVPMGSTQQTPVTGAGTVSNAAGGTTVTGTGTTFRSTLKVGDTIIVNGQSAVVTAIASDTSLTTATPLAGANTNASYSYTSAAGTGNCTPLDSGPCSVANLTQYFGATLATQASGICNAESRGVASLPSGVDKCQPSGTVVSYGLFQINLTANRIGGLDCPSAVGPTYTGSNHNCSIRNQALFDQCVAAAKDPTKNIQAAVQIQRAGGWGRWGANSKCGY